MFRTTLFIIGFGILAAGCAWIGGCHVPERITFQPDSTASTTTKTTIPDPNLPDPGAVIEVDKEPVLIGSEAPIYPVAARRANAGGSVMVQVFVGPQGKVLRANALECDRPGYGFEIAAVAAAYKGTWRPAMLKGKPVGTWVTYKIEFAHH